MEQTFLRTENSASEEGSLKIPLNTESQDYALSHLLFGDIDALIYSFCQNSINMKIKTTT